MIGSVGSLRKTERLTASAVADGTPHLLQRMRRIRIQKQIQIWVGSKGLRRILKPFAVDRKVARGTAINFICLCKIKIVRQLLENHLLNTERRRYEIEHGRIQQTFHPRGRKFANLLFIPIPFPRYAVQFFLETFLLRLQGENPCVDLIDTPFFFLFLKSRGV